MVVFKSDDELAIYFQKTQYDRSMTTQVPDSTEWGSIYDQQQQSKKTKSSLVLVPKNTFFGPEINLIVTHLEVDNQGRQDIETLVKEARPLQYITCETLYTTSHTCVVSTYTSSTKKDDHVLKTNNMLLPQCPHVPPPFSSRARKSQHHRCCHASPAHSPSASSHLCLLQVGELDSHLGNSEKKVANCGS